jgi:hypothetical protein
VDRAGEKRTIIGHTFIDVFEDADRAPGKTPSSWCRERSIRT